jgi:hypothetical protein
MALVRALLTSPSQVEEVEKPHDRIAGEDEQECPDYDIDNTADYRGPYAIDESGLQRS